MENIAFWAIFELRTFAFLDIFILKHIANIAFWAIFELTTFAFLDIFTLEHIANIAFWAIFALSFHMHSCHMHFRLLCTVVICTFVCYAQLSYALSFVMHSCHMLFRLLCAFWAIFELRAFAFLDIFTLEHIANIAFWAIFELRTLAFLDIF